MADDRGASPGAQPAAPASTPAATPQPSSLANSQDSKIAEAASKANSPESVRALVSSAFAGDFKVEEKKAPTEKLAEETPPAETPAEATPAGDTPEKPETPPAEGVETPPTEAETPPTEEPASEPEPTIEDEDEPVGDEITPSKAQKIRLGLPETDEVGRLAATYQRRNRDLTLEQALDMAKKKLGAKPTEEPAAPAPAADGLPTTVAGVDAEIEKLETEKETAAGNLALDEIAKIDRKLRRLDYKRADLVRADETTKVQQATRAEREYNTGFATSEAKAIELYPFVTDLASAGGKRVVEIETQLKENNDPLYNHPNKPLIIAQMVAGELKIAPKSKKPPVAQPKPPVVTPPANTPPKSVLPGGGSRTTPPATSAQQTAEVAKIKALSTPADVEKHLASLGITT